MPSSLLFVKRYTPHIFSNFIPAMFISIGTVTYGNKIMRMTYDYCFKTNNGYDTYNL